MFALIMLNVLIIINFWYNYVMISFISNTYKFFTEWKQKNYFHTHFSGRAIAVKIQRAFENLASYFSTSSKDAPLKQKNQWYNQIDLSHLDAQKTHRIYLGMAPHQTQFFGVALPENVEYLAILKQFEYDIIYKNNPTLRSFSKKIATEDVIDNQGMSLKAIDDGISLLEDQINRSQCGKGIYLHCKSGVGRSATVLAAYIMKRLKETDPKGQITDQIFETAIGMIQRSRPDAQLTKGKHRAALKNWVQAENSKS
jgi:hypothetical protein